MKQYIEKCLFGENLSVEESSLALERIMNGDATESQVAGLMVALRAKGESVEEIVGFARTMRAKAFHISVHDPDAIDMCGTGGDGLNTFNVSTVASLVAAGAGVTIVKHGNRSVSSTCGSADVLKALGVKIDVPIQRVEQCVNETGIGFLFAPMFHPAMKYAAKPRVELGIKSIFNMLGPITNPAGVKKQVIGTYEAPVAEKLARAISMLGAEHVCVLHSDEGVDEILLSSPTSVYEVKQGNAIRNYHINAKTFQLPAHTLSEIQTTGVEQNTQLALQVLKGTHGAARDTVLANAAMGIFVAGKSDSLLNAVELAKQSLDSGNAYKKLQQLIEFTNAA
ncbi:MAG TPA: anthranilate phosphoribosyltransferase [Bacteroidota bacterium]|nr:anthranilate phosphoribosyltransferase [Bacteroidota bacterium]